MSNYSAQNLNQVSIKTNLNQTDNDKPKKRAEDDSSSTVSNDSDDKLKLKVKARKVQKIDLMKLFDQTFLSVFIKKDDPLTGSGKYDYAFHVGNHRLYVIVNEEYFETDTPKIKKSLIEGYKQQAASKLNKKFHQLQNKLELPKVNFGQNSENEESIQSVYCIGLTLISVKHNDETIHINHEYGSLFFQEECVIDLDEEDRIIQLFSLDSFINILNTLQTPSDTISFFDFQRKALMNQEDYETETSLVHKYLSHPYFFKRAIDVQQKLVDIGLMAKVETRLQEIIDSYDSPNQDESLLKRKEELIVKLQNYSRMFQKLVNGLMKRRIEAGIDAESSQIQTLLDESMYTRMSIMEEIVAYADRTEEEYQNGYMRHQHSYNQFGHHYVLVIYGLAENAEFSRDVIERDYAKILMDINSQLQDPVMQDFFILGFDMSKHDGKGNVTVEMDVYHQEATAMTPMELRLYEQMQELSNS